MASDEFEDWPSLSSWLNLSQEHVAKGERLIARQKDLIAGLASRGADVSLHEALLATFEDIQRLHLAHRDRLARDLGEKWKSAFADFLPRFADSYAARHAGGSPRRSWIARRPMLRR
jgi:hypothetical protein